MELCLQKISRREPRSLHVYCHGVKVLLSICDKHDTVGVQFLHEYLRKESHFGSYLFKSSRSVPLHVKGSHVCQ